MFGQDANPQKRTEQQPTKIIGRLSIGNRSLQLPGRNAIAQVFFDPDKDRRNDVPEVSVMWRDLKGSINNKAAVCTENSIRVDDVTESPKLAE